MLYLLCNISETPTNFFRTGGKQDAAEKLYRQKTLQGEKKAPAGQLCQNDLEALLPNDSGLQEVPQPPVPAEKEVAHEKRKACL